MAWQHSDGQLAYHRSAPRPSICWPQSGFPVIGGLPALLELTCIPAASLGAALLQLQLRRLASGGRRLQSSTYVVARLLHLIGLTTQVFAYLTSLSLIDRL